MAKLENVQQGHNGVPMRWCRRRVNRDVSKILIMREAKNGIAAKISIIQAGGWLRDERGGLCKDKRNYIT